MELVVIPVIALLAIILISRRERRYKYDRFEDPSNSKEK